MENNDNIENDNENCNKIMKWRENGNDNVCVKIRNNVERK